MTTAPDRAALRARTSAVDVASLPDNLLDLLPDDAPLAMVRRGDGLVGWGEAARFEVSGPDRFTNAAAWWADVCTSWSVEDAVRVPGSGPVAFASFAFADDPATSVLVVPSVVIGRRAGRAWLTVIDDADPAPVMEQRRKPVVTAWAPGRVTDWRAAVTEAIRRIHAGEVAKVVLARDEVAVLDGPLDPRVLLERLAERYPTCWTFHVDGLLGASPELLVRRTGRRAESRVLAGTLPTSDTAAVALQASPKDHEEHAFAVDSLVASLSRHGVVDAPAEPTVLELANVIHLASDVTARLRSDISAIALAGALHPTAAVGGAPSLAALAVIAELEGADRGRYAGPVGWLDAHGDGEFALALRCAQASRPSQTSGSTLRLWAGCGIVADSDPDSEVAEAEAKLMPIRQALQG